MDIKIIQWLIIVGFALIIFGAMIEYVGYWNDPSATTITNESLSVTVNNTCIATSRLINTINSISSGDCNYPTARYTKTGCDQGFKVYTNGTSECPTMNLTGGNKLISYSINRPSGLSAFLIGFIASIFIVIIIFKLI